MILTSGHHLRMSGCPLSSKDPPPEMEDRGSLDREDDHFKQRLLYKSCSKWWYGHLDTISGCQDAPYPPISRCPPEICLAGEVEGTVLRHSYPLSFVVWRIFDVPPVWVFHALMNRSNEDDQAGYRSAPARRTGSRFGVGKKWEIGTTTNIIDRVLGLIQHKQYTLKRCV